MGEPLMSAEWKGFRSVLCPVDFSDTSAVALQYGAAVAERFGATITVAYANDPLLVDAARVVMHDRRMVKRSARELDDFIAAVLPSSTRRRLRMAWRVSIGPPADEILRLARHGFDAIVMGTQGLSGVNRLLLGSTTLRVLRNTIVPVLAVRRQVGSRPRGLASWPGKRILAAIDRGPQARRDVETAARVARSFGASLMLVHVIGELQAPPWLRRDVADAERTRFAKAQQWLGSLAAAARPYAPAETRIVSGQAADEIAAIAAAVQTKLLLTVLRDRQAWGFGARRGSVSYSVLTEASAPVLACPPRWRLR